MPSQPCKLLFETLPVSNFIAHSTYNQMENQMWECGVSFSILLPLSSVSAQNVCWFLSAKAYATHNAQRKENRGESKSTTTTLPTSHIHNMGPCWLWASSSNTMYVGGVLCDCRISSSPHVLECVHYCSLQRTMDRIISWWRHQIEIFSALLALCAGNSPVTGEFSSQRLVTRSFDIFLICALNKRLSKQSWDWWFETPSRSLWRHCNYIYIYD